MEGPLGKQGEVTEQGPGGGAGRELVSTAIADDEVGERSYGYGDGDEDGKKDGLHV